MTGASAPINFVAAIRLESTFSIFFCEEARLSIELDGGGHGFPGQQAHDAERTKFLASLGIKELRFWNSRLRREKQEIRDTIFRQLQARAPHPLPDYTKSMLDRKI